MHREVVERNVELDVGVEQHQLPRDPRLLGILDQGLAPFRLLDFAGALQEGFEVAIFGDQLRRGLDADAGNAGNVVGGIAGQRLHLDHLLRRHAEFLDHLGYADAAILHGVVHDDAVGDELHQVLVGGHDGRGRAPFAGQPRIGRDQVVGLEAGLLQAGQVEGAHRLANEGELGNEVVRRRRPVCLVLRIDLVAEGDFRLVEDDGQMRRPVVLRHVAQQLPEHVAETEHRVDLQAIRLAVQGRQRVIGAEDVGGAIDQEDVVALAGRFCGDRLGGLGLISLGGGALGGFRHGRNLGIFAPIDSLQSALCRDFCALCSTQSGCVHSSSVSPWLDGTPRDLTMATQLDTLTAKLRAIEAEIEVEMAKRREEMRFHLENRRIVFEQEASRLHREIKTRLSRYLLDAHPLVMLVTPVIYALVIPMALFDLAVMAYQAICFPVYGIPKVRRRDYLVFDRHHLAYLNALEKLNCAYCSYANGLAAFFREVAARTEVYWCPIKHARRVLGPHPHYQGFADFGDAEGFRKKINAMKDGVKIEGVA